MQISQISFLVFLGFLGFKLRTAPQMWMCRPLEHFWENSQAPRCGWSYLESCYPARGRLCNCCPWSWRMSEPRWASIARLRRRRLVQLLSLCQTTRDMPTCGSQPLICWSRYIGWVAPKIIFSHYRCDSITWTGWLPKKVADSSKIQVTGARETLLCFSQQARVAQWRGISVAVVARIYSRLMLKSFIDLKRKNIFGTKVYQKHWIQSWKK